MGKDNWPQRWIKTELETVVEKMVNGANLKQEEVQLEGYLPISRIETIAMEEVDLSRVKYVEVDEKIIDKYSLQKGDILFSHINSDKHLGKTAIFNGEVELIHGINLLLIRAQSGFDKKLLNYLFRHYRYQGKFIEVAQRAVNQSSINQKKLNQFQVPIIPELEQKRIVAKLDALFGHLDTLKTKLDRIPELLKNFRQQVLTQAVTGKLTEEWRVAAEEEGKGLEIDLKKIIKKRIDAAQKENDKLTKEGRKVQNLPDFDFKGKNEIGWLKTTVESASIFIIDCLHDTAKFSENSKYLIDTNCIRPFKIDFEKARTVDDVVYQKWISRLKPSEGDILFSREGTIGIAVQVPENIEICIGQRMMLFRFYNELMNSRFSEILLNSNPFRTQFHPFIKGATAQHLNIRDIRKLEINIPSRSEQEEIVERVDALFALADSIETQYHSLKSKIDNLPQAILNKAFKGELVPQDENDEPASELLERIKSLQEETAPKPKKAKNYKLKKSDLSVAAEEQNQYH